MSTLQRFALVCILGAATAAILPGCGSSDDSTGGGAGAAPVAGSGPTAGAAGSGTAGAGMAGASNLPVGNAANGQAAFNTATCNACHGTEGQGDAMTGPNISGSTTAGTGSWTQAQFFAAVREGKLPDGSSVCPLMIPFTTTDISDQALADVYAWLKTKPNDTPERGKYCP